MYVSLFYSGTASNYNVLLAWSHYCTSFWQDCKDPVWSQGQPTTRVGHTTDATNAAQNTQSDERLLLFWLVFLIKDINRWEPLHFTLCSIRYRWTKDGEDFVPPRATTIKTQRTDGSFVLHNKQFIQFQGTYRCYAFNKLGTAMTEEIALIVPSEKSSSVMLKCCLNLLKMFILKNCSASFLAYCLFLLSCPQVSEGGRTPHCCWWGWPNHVALWSSKRCSPTPALLDVPWWDLRVLSAFVMLQV